MKCCQNIHNFMNKQDLAWNLKTVINTHTYTRVNRRTYIRRHMKIIIDTHRLYI